MKKRITFMLLLCFALINTQAANANNFTEFSKIVVPPVNDECSSATELTVNQDNLCTNTTSGTISEATASAQAVVCTNKENEANDDVWFKFVATAPSHKIELLNVSGTFTNLYHAVYEGGATGDCNALSLVFCSDPNSSVPTGLTPGNTYFVRVFSNSTAIHDTTFDICVGADPNIPDNDDCDNGQSITSLPYSDTIDASAATNNNGFIDVSGCGSMNDGVWYTIAGDGGDITVNVAPSGWDVEIAVYTGSCGDFTCVDNADLGISGTSEEVTFSSSVGVNYYINIGNKNDDTDLAEGIFNINISTTAVLSIDDLLAKGFSYYPNPVTENKLRLNANEVIKQVTIYNYMGQQLRSFSYNDLSTEVKLDGLSTGAYLVRAVVGDSEGTFKIIKQ